MVSDAIKNGPGFTGRLADGGGWGQSAARSGRGGCGQLAAAAKRLLPRRSPLLPGVEARRHLLAPRHHLLGQGDTESTETQLENKGTVKARIRAIGQQKGKKDDVWIEED